MTTMGLNLAPPPNKKPRYFEPDSFVHISSDDDVHADQEGEDELDPETYCETGKRQNTPYVITKIH